MLTNALSASLLIAATQAASGTYDYVDIGDNWKAAGFPSPDCAAGREQSPIDLVKATFSTDSEQPDMKFEGYDYKDYTEGRELLNGGQNSTLKMNLDSGNLRTQFPDGTTDSFNALQFHFHSPSEHAVNGELLPLEMHVVHVHEDPAKFSVIGFFFEVGDTENEFIKQLGFDAATGETNPLTDVDFGTFLGSVDMSSFWHYDGSFTTPPCTEGVKWWVIEEVQSISQAQLDAYQSYNWGTGKFSEGMGNNRRVQPLNDRTLYYKGSESKAAALVAFGAAALSMLALF